MNTTLQLLLKDLRQLRWPLGLLALFWIAYGWAVLHPTSELSSRVGGLWPVVCLLLGVVVVGRSVQNDSIRSSTAWWRTRPIDEGSWTVAKAGMGMLAIVFPVLALSAIIGAGMGFNVATTLPILLEATVLAIAAASLAMAVAMLSSTLLGFLAGGLCLTLIGSMIVGASLALNHAQAAFDPYATNAPSGAYAIAAACLSAGAIASWAIPLVRENRLYAGASLALGYVAAALVLFAAPASQTSHSLQQAVENPLTVQPLTNESPNPATQPIWQHFTVGNLQTNEFASVINASMALIDGRQTIGRVLVREQQLWQTLARRNSAPFAARAVLERFFPDATIWSTELWGWRRAPDLPFDRIEGTPSNPRGRLTGSLALRRFQVGRVADIPIESRTIPLEDGDTLQLCNVQLLTDRVDIRLQLNQPGSRPWLVGGAWGDDKQLSGTKYLLVVYNQQTREAHVPSPDARSRWRSKAGLFPVTTQTYETSIPLSPFRVVIAGGTHQQWLNQARLHIFRLQPLADQEFDVDVPDFQIYPPSPEPAPGLNQRDPFELSSTPTPEQARQEIRRLLAGIPNSWNQETYRSLRATFESLTEAHIEALLEALPVEQRIFSNFIEGPIRKKLQARHLPAVRRSLQDNWLLLNTVTAKKWATEVRDVILSRLSERGQAAPVAAIRIAAQAQDPNTYSDLAWHFIHASYGHDRAIPALEACPGFDFRSAIEAAWKRARFGMAQHEGLLIDAARLGLEGALKKAILEADHHRTQENTKRAQELRDALKPLTHYSGPADDSFNDWLLDHLDRFTHNPDTSTYSAMP